MDGTAEPPQGPEEETAVPAASAHGPGPGGNKFADIRRLLAEGAFPPAFGSMKRKNLKRYAQKFVLEGGYLYYVGSKKAPKREVVVEPERRRQVFLESHFTESGHHLGQKKTAQRIQSRYYWLGVVKDVVDWIRVCQTCQNAEHTKNVVRKARPAKAEAPWEILGMELQATALVLVLITPPWAPRGCPLTPVSPLRSMAAKVMVSKHSLTTHP